VKLPYNLQERWVTVASKFKRDNVVPYPPFIYFASFISEETKIRNDPNFACVTTLSLRTEKISRFKAETPADNLSEKRMCQQQGELIKILSLTRPTWTLINIVLFIVNRTQ